ncbi:hypothetical protein EJ06DRAFT_450194, partial [Trichodelitschia bisporula]
DGDPEWIVQEIADSRWAPREADPSDTRRGKHRRKLLQYKIKYSGFPDWNKNPQWQPYWDTVGCRGLLEAYHSANPTKAGPHPSF